MKKTQSLDASVDLSNKENRDAVQAVASTVSELNASLASAYAERLALRREQLANKLNKPHLLRNNRRKIARLKTSIHAKTIEELKWKV